MNVSLLHAATCVRASHNLIADVEHSSAPQAGLYAPTSLPEVQYEGFEQSPYQQEEFREDEFAQVHTTTVLAL